MISVSNTLIRLAILIFNIGKLKWTDSTRTAEIGELAIEREVRDGVLVDHTGHIPLSIWGKDIIQQIDEDKTYKFTNLIVQNYEESN